MGCRGSIAPECVDMQPAVYFELDGRWFTDEREPIPAWVAEEPPSFAEQLEDLLAFVRWRELRPS